MEADEIQAHLDALESIKNSLLKYSIRKPKDEPPSGPEAEEEANEAEAADDGEGPGADEPEIDTDVPSGNAGEQNGPTPMSIISHGGRSKERPSLPDVPVKRGPGRPRKA